MAQPIRELHSETNKEVITLLLHQLNIIILHMCSCNIVPVSIETKLAKVLDIGTSALHCKSPPPPTIPYFVHVHTQNGQQICEHKSLNIRVWRMIKFSNIQRMTITEAAFTLP